MKVGEQYNPWKLFTGIFIPESIVRLSHEILSPGAKLLFGRLCWHAGKNGECFPSHVTLAEEIGVAERTIRDYLKELEDGGFVIRIRAGNYHMYGFIWHQSLEDSLRVTEKEHRHDPAGAAKNEENDESTGASTGTIPPKHRHDPAVAYKDVREELREVRELKQTPIVPFPEEVPTEPLTGKYSETDVIAVDAKYDSLHNRLESSAGRKIPRALSKNQRKIDGLLAEKGLPHMQGKLDQFFEDGGKSMDEFLKEFRPPVKRIGAGASMGRQSNRRPQEASFSRNGQADLSRTYSPRSVDREVTAPPEAYRWNAMVPDHQWKIWDADLQKAWESATAGMGKHFDVWLLQCQKLSPAAKQHQYGAKFTLAKALEQWVKILNGDWDWLLKKAEEPMTATDRLIAKYKAQAAEEAAAQ